jgi:Carbohydrate family 9 binding domain-like
VTQRCGLITLALAAVAVSLKLASFQTSAAYTSDAQLEAKRATVDFALDGNVDKKLWKRANWVEFIHNMAGNANYPEQATRVASLWTDGYVYFAFSCRYDVLNVFEGEDVSKEKWELWNRDVVEIFLNPQPERQLHYYEFEVAPNNRWIDLEITRGEKPNHDPSWNSGFQHATRVDARHHIWTSRKSHLAQNGVQTSSVPEEKAPTLSELFWRGAPSRKVGPSMPPAGSEFCGWLSDGPLPSSGCRPRPAPRTVSAIAPAFAQPDPTIAELLHPHW